MTMMLLPKRNFSVKRLITSVKKPYGLKAMKRKKRFTEKQKEKMPKHCELVFCAWLDVKHESFQYYVGWYNADEKEWFLADFGYTSDVAFWMPIPKLDMSDL